MDRNSNIWILLLVAGCLNFVYSQAPLPAKVPFPEVTARVKYTANFTGGTYGVPIQTCIVARNGPKPAIVSFPSFDKAAAEKNRLQYFGAGLDKGECGVLITSVEEDDGAQWNIRMITGSGIYDGNVRLNILKKPTPPVFDKDIRRLTQLTDTGNNEATRVIVSCSSHSGQPPPKYKWFLDNTEMTEGVQPYGNRTANGHIWTYQDIVLSLTWKDDKKTLRCEAVHDALLENDPKEVTQAINYRYTPRADSLTNPVFVPSLGEEASIAVNVSANPAPGLNDIDWVIDGKTIRPGQTSQDGRFKAHPARQVNEAVWECKLTINEVEEEDLAKVYKLRVRNNLSQGYKEFNLSITASNPEAGGLSAGGIVGLVLGIPALLIIIAVIVVYTRARGLLCFKGDDGTASEKERMDGESGGGVEEKPAPRKLSSRLSALYENLVSKKKDKTAPVEDEVPKDKDSKETTDPASQEKKPEDIVYAELDLVNEGTGGKPVIRGNEDKTEYAEIIGVVPQSTAESGKKDKSPTGSNKSSPKK